jgi:hypothetical protein
MELFIIYFKINGCKHFYSFLYKSSKYNDENKAIDYAIIYLFLFTFYYFLLSDEVDEKFI